MVEIQSKEVIDKIGDDLKVQPSMAVPRELSKDIQLSYNVNPVRQVRLVEGVITDATTGVIFTTSTTRRTFIIAAQLSVAKSVLSTSVSSNLACFTVGAPARALLLLRYEPVTAGQEHISISFPVAIELERGTAITLNNSTAIPSIDLAAQVMIYEKDPQ